MPRLKGPVPQVQAKEGPMPQIVKKRRSGWAILAAGALVASLLAVGAGPGRPRSSPSDANTATLKSSRYGGVRGVLLGGPGSPTLATLEGTRHQLSRLLRDHHGRTADTFDPQQQREARAHGSVPVAGLLTPWASTLMRRRHGDADFGDIAESGRGPAERHQGTRRGMASWAAAATWPSIRPATSRVLRWLVALVGLVDKVSDNSQLFNADGSAQGFGAAELAAQRQLRRRLRAAVPRAGGQRHQPGPTSWASPLGKADGTTFSSDDGVPRRNMATFIMRTLDHSNAPSGWRDSIQRDVGAMTDRPTLFASRCADADLEPVVEPVRVDAFWIAAERVDEAFKPTALARSLVRSVDFRQHRRCEIDGTDR